MYNSINEECGVFGVYNSNCASEATYLALQMLQHRGQEGCGIVSYDNDLKIHKGEGLVTKVFSLEDITALSGKNAIGHVRYSTTGGSQLINVQPFIFNSTSENFALCHNGNIVNSKQLKIKLEQKGTIFQSTSDSEIIAHLLKHESGEFITRLKNSLKLLVGAFVFLFLYNDELYIVLDNKGLRPLSIGKKDASYFVSSETCAFDLLDVEFIRDVLPGEIIKINSDGLSSYFYDEVTSNNMCAMEYIYFARPDSIISGHSVYKERERTGIELAKENKVDADIVIGVPDSGLAAAEGFASYLNMTFVPAIVKNKYSGRSFILPSDELRIEAVRLKLSIIKSLVKDKRVILVDDSIVRGHTSKKIVSLLFNAGAKEVHLKIAAPKIKYPCFYGVDYSTYEELIANKYSTSKLVSFIGCNSIQFLEPEKLCTNTCQACFTGNYPTELFDDFENANTTLK